MKREAIIFCVFFVLLALASTALVHQGAQELREVDAKSLLKDAVREASKAWHEGKGE